MKRGEIWWAQLGMPGRALEEGDPFGIADDPLFVGVALFGVFLILTGVKMWRIQDASPRRIPFQKKIGATLVMGAAMFTLWRARIAALREAAG